MEKTDLEKKSNENNLIDFNQIAKSILDDHGLEGAYEINKALSVLIEKDFNQGISLRCDESKV